jgi:cytochrome c oxidase cbb3-type subunit 3
MNALVIKALAFAAVLIIATLVVVKQMNVNLDDPINQLTLFGAVVIAVLSFGVAAKYVAQMKTDTATGELLDENWDGIGEYKNELPSGWAYSFLGMIIWTIWYFLIGYPVNAYSQIGEYNEEVKAYQAKYEEKYKNPSDETLMQMGESVFLVQCAPCHGTTGDGLDGKAEDFTKTYYSKERVLDIIKNGQNELHSFPGGMPAGMAQGDMAEEIATYVAGGFKGTAPATFGVCAGCHGANGEGITNVGPRINGFDITNTLAAGKKGKIGEMPSFKTMISPVQEKALDVYIQSLSK